MTNDTAGPGRLWRLVKRFEAGVLVGLILAAGALWAFLSIADEMAEGETSAIDRQLLLLLRAPGDTNNPIGSKGLEESVRDVTALGGTTLVAVVTTSPPGTTVTLVGCRAGRSTSSSG